MRLKVDFAEGGKPEIPEKTLPPGTSIVVTCSFFNSDSANLFPDLNPISLFGIISHALSPTSSTARLAVKL